jgi:acyl carrier protein
MQNGIEKARTMLAEAIGADTTAVPADARIGQFERWDSLAHMRLILSLETRIGRRLDPEEAIGIEGLEDVARLVDSVGSA